MKRKSSLAGEESAPASKPRLDEETIHTGEANGDKNAEQQAQEEATVEGKAQVETQNDSKSIADRKARFEALKARNSQSRASNRKETAAEAQRLSTDPTALQAVQRKHAIASHKLLKADAEAAGEDFERKRAWDWTAEESEKWDERMAEKQKHRDDVAFQDWQQNARKTYERQVKGLNVPDLAKYHLEKEQALRAAAEDGSLQVIEDVTGEILPVDHSGHFFPTADAQISGHKPDKEALERLVADMKKDEDTKLKNRKRRGRNDDDGDVTYINDRNKQFNLKLARAYNKYTTEIRDNFERGTAI